MKTKPTAHKESNTFKFKTFAEQLASINIALPHHYLRNSHYYEEGEESTKFCQTLQKWEDFNCSQDFQDVRRKLGSPLSVSSLSQILYRQHEIVKILKETLSNPQNQAVDVCLELTVSLAFDLQNEFYPHFLDIFQILVQLLNVHEPILIENTFLCLAFLFKSLWRYIVKDFEKIFLMFSQSLLKDTQKDYVQRFAAQCFSFLVRKLDNVGPAVDLLFHEVDSHDCLCNGIGLLLFESVKGIQGQLHSFSSKFLPVLLDSYIDIKWVNSKNVQKSVALCFNCMSEHLLPEKSNAVWQPLTKIFKDVHKPSLAFSNICQLMSILMKYKKCRLVNEGDKMLFLITTAVPSVLHDEQCLSILLSCASSVILNLYLSLPTKSIKDFCAAVFSSDANLKKVFILVRNLLSYPFFERDILPPFLNFFASRSELLSAEYLQCLVELVFHKAPKTLLQQNAVNKPYVLAFPQTLDEQTFAERLMCVLEEHESLTYVWCCLVCLPHLKPCNEASCASKIITVFLREQRKLVDESLDGCDTQLSSFIILEAIHALTLLNYEKTFNEIGFSLFLDLLKSHPSQAAILQATNYYLEYAKQMKSKTLFDDNFLIQAYQLLEQNLCSPHRTIRILTLRLLMLLDTSKSANTCDDEPNAESIFGVCLSADLVELSVQTYREKQRFIQKLEATSPYMKQAQERFAESNRTAVFYLFGVLYDNFSLLWSSTIKVLETHFRGKDFTELWTFFLRHYQEMETKIRSAATVKVVPEKGTSTDPFVIELLQKYEKNVYRFAEDRVDHLNHRVQLIKFLATIAEVVERKNRDVVELFFEFLTKEAYVLDISKTNVNEDITKTSNIEAVEEDDPDEINSSTIQRKNVWQTFVAFLEVFSKFHNPKAMYREPEMMNIYCELLKHRNSAMQKAAFDCIVTYNFNYITPYKDNIYRLIDDKTFKDEIVSFSLNATNDEDLVVSTEHRNGLIPYLMRILFGKMLSKTGSHTTGRSKGDLRRSIVFRFFAGCQDVEIHEFTKLSFAVLENHLQLPFTELHQYYSSMDLTKCIPLRQVISATRTLEVMAINLGNLTKTLLPYFFKVLLNVSTFTSALLERRDAIKEVYIQKLKFLRTECFKLYTKFFRMFDQYTFSAEELDDIFSAIIWPMLPSLSNESLFALSPLLKLLGSWTENPRYFVLLVKCCPRENDLYPLSAVIELYEDTKTHKSVVEFISKMLDNLVSYATFVPMETDESEELQPLNVKESAVVDSCDSNLNFGTQILLPFVPKILKRLKMNFDMRIKQKSRKSIITSEELTILMNIASHVNDEYNCKILASMFLRNFKEKQKRVEEKDIQQLQTVFCLVDQLKTVDFDLLHQAVPLFKFLHERSTRLELCNVFLSLCRSDDKLRVCGEVICMLNAYNPKIPEQPDFDVRMEGYRLATTLVVENSKPPEESSEILDDSQSVCLSCLVYNCLSIICIFDDLGLREASSTTVQLIIKTLIETGNVTHFKKLCISQLLMKEMKKGLSSKNENTRHEFIIILRTLVKHGKDLNPFLNQLHLLYEENDEDLDFFTTIRHIQLHRRARALHRLAKNSYIFKAFHSKVLSDFVLPIVSSFLLDERSIKNGNLFNAAVEVFGAICRYLSWPIYNALLCEYLQLLTKDYDNHKSIVKILTTILTNFNYDLSNSKFIEEKSDVDFVKEKPLEVPTEKNSDMKCEKQLLNAEAATNVHNAIIKVILPKLHYHLQNFSHADYEYDSMKSQYPEDDEIQRVPIAFAIVSLLKNLPQRDGLLESNIPSVLLRLCHFLKSKSEPIRETARNSLVKVMLCLGPRFFPYMLKELQAILKKGYQIHVLTYTINVVLSHLKVQMKPGDLDPSMDNLVDICNQEIFSDFSEEKEIAKIVAKVKEAKKSKSFDTYQIIGSLASEGTLGKIFFPLKKVLAETHSHKVLKKVSICLKKLVMGLTENPSLSEAVLLTFFYGVIHDTIPDLQLIKKQDETTKKRKKDIFTVEPPRKKQRVPVKTNLSSNHFIFIQESLHILSLLLKRERLSSSNPEHGPLLNPFVPILTEFTDGKHPKLTTVALKCITNIIIKFPQLEAFNEFTNKIKDNLFLLLKKHAGLGSQSDDNEDLVVTCFKAMHYLISDVRSSVDEKQLQVLLIYAEQYINDHSKQSVAFGLLKAILTRNLDCPELKDVMTKLSEMLVQSPQDHIRRQCGQVWIKYLLNYVHGKNLLQYITFFIRQLDYEFEAGRMAVIELLHAAVMKFPEITVNSILELIFVPVASRLVNEVSSTCRQAASDLISKLLSRTSSERRTDIWNNMILSWLQQSHVLQRQLAARLASILVDVEKETFLSRLPRLLPLMEQQLNPERYVAVEDDPEASVTLLKRNDHLVYQLLVLFERIVKLDIEALKSVEYTEPVNFIFTYIMKEYMIHPHIWIRVTSVKIISHLLSTYTVESIACSIVAPQPSTTEYLLINSEATIWNICKRFIDVFACVKDYESMGDIIVRVLVYLGRVFMKLPETWKGAHNFVESTKTERRSRMSISWLLRRLCRETKLEVARNPKITIRRILVFKWIAAMVLDMDPASLEAHLEAILTPLCREITDKTSRGDLNEAMGGGEQTNESDLNNITRDVLKLIQTTVGNDLYNRYYAIVVGKLSKKRIKRKTDRAIELVMNPFKGLKRKHKKHMASKVSKKRKLSVRKGRLLKRRKESG